MQNATRILVPRASTEPLFHITKPALSRTRPQPRSQFSSSPLTHHQSSGRSYATESASLQPSRHPAGEDLSWPTPNSKNPYALPTPYQIFKMNHADPYSKRRFYELVKLYHPDRQQLSAAHEPLTPASKLQRYRMVIAANELLSDPRKRRLYDQQGIGWSGRPEFGATKPRWADADSGMRGGWSGFDDNVNDDGARNNATWEDWEAWQMRRGRTHGEQRPTYMNNGSFVVLIVVAAGIAASVETSRATSVSRSMIEQVEWRHDQNSKDLRRRREETHTHEDRNERTRNFLRVRGVMDKELEMAAVGQEREGTMFVPDGKEEVEEKR